MSSAVGKLPRADLDQLDCRGQGRIPDAQPLAGIGACIAVSFRRRPRFVTPRFAHQPLLEHFLNSMLIAVPSANDALANEHGPSVACDRLIRRRRPIGSLLDGALPSSQHPLLNHRRGFADRYSCKLPDLSSPVQQANLELWSPICLVRHPLSASPSPSKKTDAIPCPAKSESAAALEYPPPSRSPNAQTRRVERLRQICHINQMMPHPRPFLVRRLCRSDVQATIHLHRIDRHYFSAEFFRKYKCYF